MDRQKTREKVATLRAGVAASPDASSASHSSRPATGSPDAKPSLTAATLPTFTHSKRTVSWDWLTCS